MYNFKKEAKLYIIYAGDQYQIDISEVSFNQTFTENSYKVKTLHEQHKMFEGSSITKANPANFDFIMPMIQEADLSIVVDLLLDYSISTNKLLNTFDLYIATQKDVFKLTTCVMTGGDFEIEKTKILSLSISGEATKLERVGAFGTYVIPGIVIDRSATRTYNIVRELDVTLNSSLLDSIYKCSVEVQNNINWVPYDTIQASLNVADSSTSMYPSEFTITDRIVSGSFSQYITDTNLDDLQDWSTDSTLNIQALDGIYGLSLDMSNCSFTNRLSVDAIFTQKFDWRLTQNPSELNEIITYITV